jgi:hypothetical protein
MYKGKIILMAIFMVGLLAANVGAAAPAITGHALDKIVIDRTTKAEVISMFGAPQKTETLAGQEILYYQTLTEDPVTKSTLCNVLTINVGKDGKVKNLIYKRYCQ